MFFTRFTYVCKLKLLELYEWFRKCCLAELSGEKLSLVTSRKSLYCKQKLTKMTKLTYLFLFCLVIYACSNEVSKEKRPLVDHINARVSDIDANHRVSIMEDDFHIGDSIYKIRGYFMDDKLLKLVGVLHTSHVDRDDYFYFDNHVPIFSGHVQVSKDDNIASEYKYYYGADGYVDEALFWEYHYTPGKRFPHEHFSEFEPDKDSLRASEEERLMFFLTKLDMEAFEIRHLNENLDANVKR